MCCTTPGMELIGACSCRPLCDEHGQDQLARLEGGSATTPRTAAGPQPPGPMFDCSRLVILHGGVRSQFTACYSSRKLLPKRTLLSQEAATCPHYSAKTVSADFRHESSACDDEVGELQAARFARPRLFAPPILQEEPPTKRAREGS